MMPNLQWSDQAPAFFSPAYGSFASVGEKSVLPNHYLTWSCASARPQGMHFIPNGCYVFVDRPGVYEITYSVTVRQGREAAIFLVVNDMPQLVSRLLLPPQSGQVGGSLLLELDADAMVSVGTCGEAVTLAADTNSFLTLIQITQPNA